MAFIVLILVAALAVAGYNIGKSKKIGPWGGMALCLVFGILGLIVLLFLPKKEPIANDFGFSEEISGERSTGGI